MRHLALVALALLTGCPKKDKDKEPVKDSGASTAKAEAPKPVAPVKVEVTLPAGLKLEAPKPAEIGGKKIGAEVCKLDKRGSEMKHEDFSHGLRGHTVGADGAIYVLDHESKVRKYLVQSASPCELALDTKWGQSGILTVEAKPEDADKYDTIQIDPKGTIFVSGFVGKPKSIAPDGKMAVVCEDDSGRFIVDRQTGDAWFEHHKFKSDAAGKCDGASPKFEGWPDDSQPKVLDAANGLVFLDGTIDKISRVGVAKADGSKVAIVGEEKGDGDICFAAGAQTCSLGICVYDSNCRSLRIWSADGAKLVGVVNINDLFGVSYSWPEKLVVGKDAAWASWTHQASGEGEKLPHYGLIARITGLN